jgi:putative methyltransferase (TIGR04325 family)
MTIGSLLLKKLRPFVEDVSQRVIRLVYPPTLKYAPKGWQTPLNSEEEAGWNTTGIVTAESERWTAFSQLVKGAGPLGFCHEHCDPTVTRNVSFHNVSLTFGYVLALAAQGKTKVSVLDYGGGLGHYYQIGRTLLPDLVLDYHCKDVPLMVEAGRRVNPDIRWFTDDRCLGNSYDLVMISGSLQYQEQWREFLRSLAPCVGEYLYLARVPVVEAADSFVAIQRSSGAAMRHWQFNRQTLLQTLEEASFRVVREFVVGDRPYIRNAPEQCELRSWLFRRI